MASANWQTDDALRAANAQIRSGQTKAGMDAQQKALSDLGIVQPTAEGRAAAIVAAGGTAPSSGNSGNSGWKDYDLSDQIKQRAAASLEAELAGLKGAYEKSMLGYDAAAKNLPAQYQQAKNQAAAQNAQEKRAFDERAAAAGMSSGTNAQAQLAMSGTHQSQLAALDREQAEGLSDIELQKAQLKAEYQNAMLEAYAKGYAQQASDLYKEMLRVQGIEREDQQTQAEWSREDALAEQKDKNAERDYARQLALTYGLVKPEDIGRINSLADLAAYSAIAEAEAPAQGAGYNNGTRTPKQVEEMQKYFGLTEDGKWGAKSQSKTGLSADEAWELYQKQISTFQTAFATAKSMRDRGESDTAIMEYLDGFDPPDLPDAKLEYIMHVFNLGGYREA